MKLAVYALTAPGFKLGREIADAMGADFFCSAHLSDGQALQKQTFEKIGEALAENWGRFEGHIIIAATGLAVRVIAPLLKNKREDPAVVSLGQDGRFVISLLSGHLGGANALASRVAGLTGGAAVINTATDIAGRPALEVLARDLDMRLENFDALPAVSRVLSEGGKIPVYDPGGYLWPHLSAWPEAFELLSDEPENITAPMAWVDFRLGPEKSPALILRPRVVALGLGCHRGIAAEPVRDLIERSLAEAKISPHSVGLLASVETRRHEPSLLELARELKTPYKTFTKEELGEVETPNPSQVVLKQIGVASVCEAAAMSAARTDRLLIKKQKGERATLAAALISSR